MTVGLLGGSFDPPHPGHLHISLAALHRLGLDRVWWLVSPQNPLKADRPTAPLADRLAAARAAVRHPAIQVTGIEAALGTRYTVDTLAALARRFPRTRFVWLMGADLAVELPRWRDWAGLCRRAGVAVVDRPPYGIRVGTSPLMLRFRHRRLTVGRVRQLGRRSPPVWTFLAVRQHPASSTALRRDGENGSGRG